jgi:(E)-4-hydroxy-3-methylbut-2-enyl-diphosphate synthase
MGCIVNGPGEAREADLGLAGGKGVGLIFKGGQFLKKVPEHELLETFWKEVEELVDMEREKIKDGEYRDKE